VSQKPSEIIDAILPPPTTVGSSANLGLPGSANPGPPSFASPPPFVPVLPAVVAPVQVAWRAESKTAAGPSKSNKSNSFESLNYFDANPKVASKSRVAPPPETSLDEPEREDEKSTWQRWLPLTLRETPSWLISLTVHVAIILLLALIPLSDKIRTSIAFYAGMSEAQDVGEEMTVFETPADSSELEASQALAAMPDLSLNELVVPDFTPSITRSDLLVPVSLTNGLRGRTGPMKDALLRAYGGTQGTEDAVEAGLKWLARNQRSDGSWSLVGPYNDGGVTENKPAATAMALLAFMGAGNTHQSGAYQENVLKGIGMVKKFQDKEGFFAEQSVGNQRTYGQAQCTIAICELYGMTGDPELREIAQKAVRYAEKAQGKNGGWRYAPRENGDTSVTGWYVMALISARMAGLDVDSEVLEKVQAFLDTVQRYGRTTQVNPDGERYAYQSYSIATPSMTAEGMLCRLYLGWNTKDPRIESGSEFLCSQPISADKGRISYYYWYYATTSLHHIGGQFWKEWNETMKEVLPALQIRSGKEKGSWSADGDPHEGGGGRLYSTCLAIYCLESYYRHLPLSEMAPKQ